MKLVFNYLMKFKKGTILAPLFKLLEALVDLLYPFFIGLLIDKGIKQNNTKYIIIIIGVMVVLAFIGLLLSILGQYFAAKTATNISSLLRRDLFNHIEELDFNNIDKIGTATLINRLTNDINQVQTGINLFLRLILRSPFVVFGSAIIATIISPSTSYIFWLTVGILFIFTFFIMLISIPIYNKQQRALDDVLTLSKDNLSGARIIRAFSIEENEIESNLDGNKKLIRIQKKASFISSFFNSFTYLMINLGIVLLIYVGAIKVYDGIITSGNIVALYNYMGQILIELIKLTNLVILINKSLASAARVKTILDLNNSLYKDVTNNKGSYIEFKNVDFTYNPGAHNILTNINFSINKGDVIGIIGPSGAGKTTLLNLMMHSYDTTNGTIIFNGSDINNYQPQEIYSKIAVTNQKNVLFRGTIRDNLKISNLECSDEELIEALKVGQCEDFILKRDNPLDYIVEAGGKNFSGGQRQRLCIARTIASRKDVLIFDDSTSSLDYLTDSNFRKALKNIDYKPTIIISSQRASTMLEADKILVLNNGNQEGFDNSSNLLKSCETYQDIYYTQFSKEDNK